jgi:uncharacterized protein
VTDDRPLILLPPSKGKADGGTGPGYRGTLRPDHPLTPPRSEVLDALLRDLDVLDDEGLARVAGVGAAKVAGARALLRELAGAPTRPAHQRYTGIVHGNAGLAEVDPARVGADVRIVSALLGLVRLDEPVPDYRLEFAASLPSLGGLGPYWRATLADHLGELAAGRRVWDLLPGEHRRVWDPSVRAGLEVTEVAFLRPDGRPANAARTKVAKGRFVAALLGRPELQPRHVSRSVDLGEGWRVTARGGQVTATFTG